LAIDVVLIYREIVKKRKYFAHLRRR